jgi:hypothetical protein
MEKVFIPAMAGILPNAQDMKPGLICLANEAAFNASFLSEALTAYSVGTVPVIADLEAELQFLAPAVQTARRFEYRIADNADAFLTETDDSDIRALGAEFKTVKAFGTKQDSSTLHKGLTKRLDMDQVGEDPLAKESAVMSLKARLIRAEIYRAATLLGAINSSNKNWATGGNDTDPDTDLPAAILASVLASGVYPNRIAFGPGAWLKRVISLRKTVTAGGFASGGFNETELAAFLGVDTVRRCKTVRTSGANAKASLMGVNKVIGYYADDMAGKDDPSNIKRFTTGSWQVFEQQVGPNTVDITVGHRSRIAVTASLGVFTLDVA